MKPGKTFNLSKQTKRMMCNIVDPVSRNQFKRMMIDAQLHSEVVVKTVKRENTAPRGTSTYKTNDTGTAATSV
jgi:hypothetical protein